MAERMYMDCFKNKNFLDYIPQKNKKISWDADEQGVVTLHVEHRGIFAKLTQKFLGKPRISHVTLERFGSFMWQQIDGERSIYELGKGLRKEFGDDAEPLYERLVPYAQTLYRLGYVEYNKN